MYQAESVNDSTRAGITIPPLFPFAITGNSFSFSENKYINTKARKKDGKDENKYVIKRKKGNAEALTKTAMPRWEYIRKNACLKAR